MLRLYIIYSQKEDLPVNHLTVSISVFVCGLEVCIHFTPILYWHAIDTEKPCYNNTVGTQ